jgi:hypothetical protein
VAKGNLVIDLFGDPVVPPQDGRGRPEHRWSVENSNKALLAFARGLTVKQAALIVGVSSPTFRKVYFSEVRKRRDAQLRMEMTQLARLNEQAAKGNVTAEKELFKLLDKLRQRDAVRAASPAPTARPEKLGKKAAAAAAAAEVKGRFEPPPPPERLLN